jgi:hypothetical protein
MVLTVSSPAASSISATAILAPSFAKRHAEALPIPEPAAVIMATLSANLIFTLLFQRSIRYVKYPVSAPHSQGVTISIIPDFSGVEDVFLGISRKFYVSRGDCPAFVARQSPHITALSL